MKKIILGIIIGLVVIFVGGIVIFFFSLNSLVKKGVETVGPKVTKVDVVNALASAAVLVMGEGAEQTPLAVISDVPFVEFQNTLCGEKNNPPGHHGREYPARRQALFGAVSGDRRRVEREVHQQRPIVVSSQPEPASPVLFRFANPHRDTLDLSGIGPHAVFLPQ